ncbi:hypothetical protein GF324_06260 [bacterium]|nr:hypothetical protein [bacterium]
MKRFAAWVLVTVAVTAMGWLMSGCGQTDEETGAGWFEGHPMYEIYPRAFTSPGTFRAMEAKLPEIKGLGARIVWLMPIHPIGEVGRKGTAGSPYSVRDYY